MIVAEMIVCAKCETEKPVTEFYRDGRTKRGGYFPSCKECVKRRVSDWQRANPDRRAEANRRWRERNPDRWRAITLAKYGLGPDEYDHMLASQRGVCAICRRKCSSGQALSVDHDHVTGRVRGLLCRRCNTAIGALDTAELLDAAKEYLG